MSLSHEEFIEAIKSNGPFIIEFRKSLDRETDRGCVLMSAAYLDHLLGNLLRAVLVEDEPKAIGELFGSNGPLATFSSRINLSFAMGLISSNVRHDLNMIRKIRNKFAHEHSFMDLSTSDLPGLCGQLRQPKMNFRNERDKFIKCSSALSGILQSSALLARHYVSPPEHPLYSFDLSGLVQEMKKKLLGKDYTYSDVIDVILSQEDFKGLKKE